MASYLWTGSKGSDWFSAANWYAEAGGSGVPGPGDTAYVDTALAPLIFDSEAGGSAALDGVTILLGMDSGTIAATVSLEDVAFGAATTLTDDLGTGYGEVVAGGTVSDAGTLEAAYASMVLDLSAGASFTNSGTLAATFGTLDIIGGAAATLFNTGFLGDLAAAPGAAVTVCATLVNTGTVTEAPLYESGLVAGVSLDAPVLGSGTLLIGADGLIALGGGVAATQKIDFATTIGTLDIGALAGFAGAIGALTGHDIIDIAGLAADATSFNAASGVLTLLDGRANVGTLDVADGTSLTATTDGRGGTVLTTELAGTPAQLANYIVNGTTASSGGAHWAPSGNAAVPLVLSYAFDPAAGLTTAEAASLVAGLQIWSAIANVAFTLGATASAQILFTTNDADDAVTYRQSSGAILTAATVDIDTALYDNLDGPGATDPTGNGGYGFLTVIHEEGHALGLNHPGPYDGAVDIGSQQLFYDDTRQYSVMSYIDAVYTGADYTAAGTLVSPQTPMLDDILAIQSVYGANRTVLTGGDTFGFNSDFGTASAHPLESYDFTRNPVPVVALYDAGTGNTLDLSGFTAGATVDLAPGSFSSADGLTDNIAIAYDTRIDGAVGGSGRDLFEVNADSDTITGGGGSDTVAFGGARADYTLATSGTELVVTGVAGGFSASDTLNGIQTLAFADQSMTVACFRRGTRLRTPAGDVAVEDLRVGMAIATASGAAAPVTWLGQRRIDCRAHPVPALVQPVRIVAGAWAPGIPARDLDLSPDHAVVVAGARIPVRHLVNGTTVAQLRTDSVEYWHVELPAPDVLLAEGLPAESYRDTGNRDSFDNAPPWRLHPLRHTTDVISQGAPVAAVRARLAARAVKLGFCQTPPSGLTLATARGTITAAWQRGIRYRYVLPPATHTLRLVSTASIARGDPRLLGACIGGILLDGVPVGLTSAALGQGFHALETGGGTGWRWTDGEAELHAGAARVLELLVRDIRGGWRAGRQAISARRASRKSLNTATRLELRSSSG